MPESTDKQSPENIIQNVILNIQSTISGPDASKHFDKIKKSTDKVRKALKPAIAQFKKLSKQIGSRTFKTFAKTQRLIGNAVKKSTGFITRQTRRLRDQHQQMRRNVRVNRSFTDSFLKMTAVVGGLTLALRALKKFADTRIDVRLLGVDLARLEKLLKGSGLRDTLTFDLISQFSKIGLPQQVLAQNETIQKGLIELQKSFAGLGEERGKQLIIDIAKAIPEPTRLAQFLTTAANGAVKDALLAARDDRSIGEVFRGLNALTAQREIEEGKASPALEAAIKTQQSLDDMSAAIETTSKKLITEFAPAVTKAADAMTAAAERISKMDSSTVKTLGVLGIVGAGLSAVVPVLLGLKGLSIAKGVLGGLAASGAGQTVPVIEGFAAKRIAQETVKRAIPRLLGQVAGRVIASSATAAAASAAVIAAPVAIGGGVIVHAQKQREEALRQQFQGFQDLQQRLGAMSQTARQAQQSGDPLQALRGKRLEIDRHIIAADPDSKQLGRLRIMRKQVVQQIETLIAKQSDLTDVQKKLKTATDKAVKPIEKVSKAVKALGATAAKVDPLTRALQRSVVNALDLEKATELQSTITNLRRLERDIASTTPIGAIGALPQLQALQDAQRQDLQAIQKQLENMVINTPDAEIRANRLRAQQLQILLRMRQDTQALVNSFDLFGQVIGASGSVFEKILITSKKNLGAGLEKGIIGSPIEQITGSLTPKRLRPRTLADLGIQSPFTVLPQRPVLSPRPQLPQPPTKAETLTKQLNRKQERIKGLFTGAIEGFREGGLSDSIERAKNIAKALQKANEIAQKMEKHRTQIAPQSKAMTVTRQSEEEILKRHPKARRLTYTSVGGTEEKLRTAGQLLIEASKELEIDRDTEDRGARPSAAESNVIN